MRPHVRSFRRPFARAFARRLSWLGVLLGAPLSVLLSVPLSGVLLAQQRIIAPLPQPAPFFRVSPGLFHVVRFALSQPNFVPVGLRGPSYLCIWVLMHSGSQTSSTPMKAAAGHAVPWSDSLGMRFQEKGHSMGSGQAPFSTPSVRVDAIKADARSVHWKQTLQNDDASSGTDAEISVLGANQISCS
jgi:hypothetical protein